MADFDLELEGFQNVIESLNDLEADLDSDRAMLVGTAVNYALFGAGDGRHGSQTILPSRTRRTPNIGC